MKTFLPAAAIAAALLFAGAAQAQSAPRNFENGPVWTIAYIETKPAMLNDYMAYIAGPYTALREAGKRRGEVLDYKVLEVNSPRDGEANLILMVEYRNMAAFDRTQADSDRDDTAVFGSLAKGNQSQTAREAIRRLRGNVLVRELTIMR
jgi:hypothetical protein